MLIPIADKLHRVNFLVWRVHALATIRGTQFSAYLDSERHALSWMLADKDGKPTDNPNPTHEIWQAQDYQVLRFLFNSISPAMMILLTHCTKADVAWSTIEEVFSHTHAPLERTLTCLSSNQVSFQIYLQCTFTLYLLTYGDELVCRGN